MKVAVIGGGPTGLIIGLRVSQKGHQITVFEKGKKIGGLSKTFKRKDWQWPVEQFYHHLFSSDKTAKKVISQLGLKDKLFHSQPKTSIFKNHQFLRLDSPLSVLKFPYFSFLEKVRFSLVTLYLKLSNNFLTFEKIPAVKWLERTYGKKVYQFLWEPLLKSKFPFKTSQISLSWFWARIKVRSSNFGYLKGSFQVLINKLEKKIKENGGQILTNHEIKSFKNLKNFDKIIFTTPISVFLKIAKNKLPKSYQEQLKKLKMLGALNLILVLKEKFLKDGTYWLNINEKNYPFVAVIEHTNFIPSKHYNKNKILYIGGYYPQNHPFFKMSKEQILKEFLPYLKKINPQFNLKAIIDSYFFTDLNTQPLRIVNYLQLIPSSKTPIKNTFLANMQLVYPYDRGINYAFQLGIKIANEME